MKLAVRHAVVFAILVLAGLPRGFEPIRAGVDESWIAGLHYAFAEKLRFGVDVVFTYGPWGFASAPLAYAPTMPWVVGYQALLKFALAGAIAGLTPASRWGNGFLFATAAAFIFIDPELGEIACWFWLLNECVGGRWGRGWAGVASGLLAVGKGTHLWLALLVAALILVVNVVRRWVPTGPITFVAAALAAWFLAGQLFRDLDNFLMWSWEIANGYTAAMSVWNRFDWFAPPMLLGSLLVVLPIRKSFGQASFCLALLLAAASFKIGFVRVGPERVATALSTMTVVALAIGAVSAAWSRTTMAGIAILLATGCFLPREHRWDGLASRSLERFDPALRNWRFAWASFDSRQAWAVSQSKTELQLNHLPTGTIDVSPHHQAIAVAKGWDYRPRPIFQSYQAYTKTFATWNAQYFAVQSPPQEVLALVEPLDLRFAAMDDGYCWPVWRINYHVEGAVGPFIRLKKRERPLELESRAFETLRRRFGERWTLPSASSPDAFVWVEFVFDETLLHRTATLAYKSVRPTISIDGGEARELIPSLARRGFVISPTIESTESLRRFLANERLALAKSVVLDAPQPLYGLDYEVRLSEMKTSEN